MFLFDFIVKSLYVCCSGCSLSVFVLAGCFGENLGYNVKLVFYKRMGAICLSRSEVVHLLYKLSWDALESPY